MGDKKNGDPKDGGRDSVERKRMRTTQSLN